MTDLFVSKEFISHSNIPLTWKIECDVLTDADLKTLAKVVSERFRFGSVVGVPRGGLRFAAALAQYATGSGRRLIVDDVLTTGRSMNEMRQNESDIGLVIFARGTCPPWVIPIFRCEF
jgi:orotate phosphoribosyltransferase